MALDTRIRIPETWLCKHTSGRRWTELEDYRALKLWSGIKRQMAINWGSEGMCYFNSIQLFIFNNGKS